MKTNNKTPVIGITLSYDDYGLILHNGHFNYIRREYGEQVKLAGGIPVFIDNTISPQAAVKLCDAIVISGGEDIDPSFYGQTRRNDHQHEPMARTLWERELIDACDEQGLPILGICYGAQLLNVHYGGTLYQDIASEVHAAIDHGQSYQAAIHPVTIEIDILGLQTGQVIDSNSRHHQAVHELAPGFAVCATAPDGVIEAISGHGHVGLQWHSESDETAQIVYRNFVKSAARRPAKSFLSLAALQSKFL